MRSLALAVLLLAGCSSETGETRQAVVTDGGLDAQVEAQVEAGPDVAPEAGLDVALDAPIDSGADSPETDSTVEADAPAVDAALEADAPVEADAACVPVYTVKDSKSGTASSGNLAISVKLECPNGEPTPASEPWLGLCELDGLFVTGCSCSHFGVGGVECGAITNGTGTVTLTIWCERSCQ